MRISQHDHAGRGRPTHQRSHGPSGPGSTARLLVDGSSPAALASFDLSVPSRDEYSLMNVFARFGYDVWTLDHEGYGRSTRTDANSDIASGLQDLIAATDLIRRETSQISAHLLGESSGAIRAAAFAMEKPERMGCLVPWRLHLHRRRFPHPGEAGRVE